VCRRSARCPPDPGCPTGPGRRGFRGARRRTAAVPGARLDDPIAAGSRIAVAALIREPRSTPCPRPRSPAAPATSPRARMPGSTPALQIRADRHAQRVASRRRVAADAAPGRRAARPQAGERVDAESTRAQDVLRSVPDPPTDREEQAGPGQHQRDGCCAPTRRWRRPPAPASPTRAAAAPAATAATDPPRRLGSRLTVVNDNLLRTARDMLPDPENSIETIAALLGVSVGASTTTSPTSRNCGPSRDDEATRMP
jgi:hypothetical protein